MDFIMNNKILSKNFSDLSSYALKKRHLYKRAKPYPHIVIKNFFDKKFLSQILDEFPDLSKIKSSNTYDNKNEMVFSYLLRIRNRQQSKYQYFSLNC